MSSSRVFVGGAISLFSRGIIDPPFYVMLYDIPLFDNAGLSYNTNEDGLRDAFDKYGEVVDGKITEHDHMLCQSLNNVIVCNALCVGDVKLWS